jgi:nitroimidazol reductase NimA-like FMN-containing flavoprotein (pyridoxamine 5'-phosphate oxidase superfamily)
VLSLKEMTRQDCAAVLVACRLGRLACVCDNRPYVVPIHFVYASDHLYSFSMHGKKIDWMRMNPAVCILVDQFGPRREWRSVIVDGRYEELPDTPQRGDERAHAWSLLQLHADWWEPGGLKPPLQLVSNSSSHLFYRIRIESLTGRQAIESNVAISSWQPTTWIRGLFEKS